MKPRILVLANQKLENYVSAVESCGGEAVLDYTEKIENLDGLLLCGGNDVHPSFYGQEINGARSFDVERDEREMRYAKAFIHTGKPIFGICRGMQLLNTALGGTLIQDISDQETHTPKDKLDLIHPARVSGTLQRLYGEEMTVNSFHHQAIDILGEGLVVNATHNGTIEGIEHTHKPFLGVQFHPERMCLEHKQECLSDGSILFSHFIEICRK